MNITKELLYLGVAATLCGAALLFVNRGIIHDFSNLVERSTPGKDRLGEPRIERRGTTKSEIRRDAQVEADSGSLNAVSTDAGQSAEGNAGLPRPTPYHRDVWLDQIEPFADSLLDGSMQLSAAGEMLSDLIESTDISALDWGDVDGIQTALIVESPDLGKASISFDPRLLGMSGGVSVDIEFYDPPGIWTGDEAYSSSLRFELELGEIGKIKSCSALLQSAIKKGNMVGHAHAEEDLGTGAGLYVDEDGSFIQQCTTRLDGNNDRVYALHPREKVEIGNLNCPQFLRLGSLIWQLRD